jgi:hypothetical protein
MKSIWVDWGISTIVKNVLEWWYKLVTREPTLKHIIITTIIDSDLKRGVLKKLISKASEMS